MVILSATMNGSGHYGYPGGNISLDFSSLQDLANHIDYGRYSLGAVFGTGDWEY